MKVRPILFSGEMVRAILSGAKTQTRRLLGGDIQAYCPVHMAWSVTGSEAGLWSIRQIPHGREVLDLRCPRGEVGDRLIVAREIPSAPNDDYCAGSDGAIYSRTRCAGRGRKELVDWYQLKPSRRGKYPSVTLCHNNKKVTRSVHSLVCEAFYGERPAGAQVRHLDGDRNNSAPDNLAWGTQSENWTDRKAHGNGISGEKHHSAKFSDGERAHVRWCIERGLCSQRHAARMLGVSQSSIQAITIGCEQPATIAADVGPRVPRLTLEITDVRVQRLQEISEADAIAEGFPLPPGPGKLNGKHATIAVFDARLGFQMAWDALYAKSGMHWIDNPWVWAITFRKVTP